LTNLRTPGILLADLPRGSCGGKARAAAAAVLVAAALAASPASAQQTAQGFALDRFAPSEAGSDWFAADSLDVRGNRLAARLVLDYAHKPLVLFDNNGNEIVAPLNAQFFAHLGVGVTLGSRVRLALNLPIGTSSAGSTGIFDNLAYKVSDSTALGDLRLGVDLALAGEYGDPFRLGLGVQVYLPTGQRSAYAGDGKLRFVPHLTAAGDVGRFVYAAQAGFDVRLRDEDFAGQPLGNGIVFAAAAGVRAGPVLIGPEAYGETAAKSGAFLKGPNTAAEVTLGAHIRPKRGLQIALGIGHGFTTTVGSPDLRILGGLTYFTPVPEPPPPPPPAPPPPPEVPSDRDNDGVLDLYDECPDVAGPADLKGCPDTDKDGIVDKDDACPKEPGPRSDDPAKNGCPPPPPDTDKDGILDRDDACPEVAGDPDPDPRKNGCPKVKIVKGAIEILDRVEFDTAKATLRPESEPVLNAIRRALAEHPEIKLVRLEGYTDSRGKPATNLRLSQSRVEAVLVWLVEHGIEPERLTAKGYGKANPIATNKTEEGRQANRRVQITILKQDEP